MESIRRIYSSEGPSKRNSFVYFEDLDFGGIRAGNYKTLYTQRDTWLDTKGQEYSGPL